MSKAGKIAAGSKVGWRSTNAGNSAPGLAPRATGRGEALRRYVARRANSNVKATSFVLWCGNQVGGVSRYSRHRLGDGVHKSCASQTV